MNTGKLKHKVQMDNEKPLQKPQKLQMGTDKLKWDV